MNWSAAQTLSWIIQQKPLELKEWTNEMGPKIEPAAKELASSIGAKNVRAWGRRKLHSSLEQIPSGDFRISGMPLSVGPHGDLATIPRHRLWTYEGTQWNDIEFDPDEIKKEWPKPPPTDAADWMLNDARRPLHTTGHLGKQVDMVRRCMKETGCTKQAALAAHKRLPKELRREVGNRGKNQQGNSPKPPV